MAGEVTLLDTSVLIARLHPARRGHEAARELLAAEGELLTTPQILRELVVAATRPVEVNGLGIDVSAAVRSVEALLERLTLTPEDARVSWRLRALLAEGRARGVKIHGANIVASALTHGADRIVSANVSDFERFADLIEIQPLT